VHVFCAKCGTAILEGSLFCNQCGQAVGGQPATVTPQAAAAPPPAYPSQVAVPAPDAPTSGKALASMISGIFGLIFFLPAFAAIVLGHIARSDIRKSNGRLQGNGMATAGLVMGYGVVAFLPFVLIIAAIAIPNLLRARMAANESSAVASIRTINTAEISYQGTYPTVGFTCQFASLDGSGNSSPSPDHAQLIDGVLASGQKSGYRFVLENCVNTETEHKYQVVAYPVARNQTGVRTFCSDESGAIKVGEGESAAECMADGSPL
jgi:type IV pilus assembly protein PilA